VKFFSKFNVLSPSSRFVRVFDFWELLVVISMTFVYTWYIFFDLNHIYFLKWFTIICIVTYFNTTILKLNTGYVEHGQIVQDRKKILKLYKKEAMLYDVIVVVNLAFSMASFDSGVVGKFFSFFVFLKLKSGI
jgi:hypothetical protein